MSTKSIIQAVRTAISPARMGTFETAVPILDDADPRALALYAWNARISAGLLAPLLLCEGFGEALLSQVFVPQLGEALVFIVKLRVIAVVALSDESAPLLNPCVIVAEIEGI